MLTVIEALRPAMDLPIEFPNEADKICAEAQAFRRLSPWERITEIARHSAEVWARMTPEEWEEHNRRREAEHEEFKRHIQRLIENNEARVRRLGIEAPNI